MRLNGMCEVRLLLRGNASEARERAKKGKRYKAGFRRQEGQGKSKKAKGKMKKQSQFRRVKVNVTSFGARDYERTPAFGLKKQRQSPAFGRKSEARSSKS
jgi:hypothetical protein